MENKEKEQKHPVCKHCGSCDVEGITRVTGYYSKISNWLPSKRQELLARQQGIYEVETPSIVSEG